jgi:3'(2'), 5'-bisphosphate nucleotidase
MIQPSELVKILEAMKIAASAAATAILEVYASTDFYVSHKADASPVTDADLRSHELICQILKPLGVASHIISEEQSDAEHSQFMQQPPDLFWLVDPLDGTKEFVRRNGEFTVNIALIYQSHPIAGVVLQPTEGLIFSGIPGVGAWRQTAMDCPAQSIQVRIGERVPVALISRSHRQIEESIVQRIWPHASFQHLGSSLKFCRLAEGSADIYFRQGPTCEWDTGAGHAVLAAAGGVLLDPATGNALGYCKPQLKNTGFIAVGDAQLAEPLLRKGSI